VTTAKSWGCADLTKGYRDQWQQKGAARPAALGLATGFFDNRFHDLRQSNARLVWLDGV
jgi:hypothetical protein